MPNKENLKGKTFRDKPERINRKGAPKKLVTTVTDQLINEGYSRVSQGSIVSLIELLINTDEEQLKLILGDRTQPMSVRIIIKAILSPRGIDVLNDLLDRIHGKSRQVVEAEIKTAEPITGYTVMVREQ